MRIGITLLFFSFYCNFSFAQLVNNDDIKKITCSDDTSHKYALYLPVGYNDTAYYPLLIFLDPGARGDLPLLMYKSLADELNIIIAGSFNSKNFDLQSSVTAFAAVYNDIVKKHRVQAGAVWLSGFSGGARAAAAIATTYNEVNGVIACGAGFAADDNVSTVTLQAYAAIVGTQDMNYTELLDNSHFLDEQKVNNIMLVFDGGHQWPPVNYLGLALEWLIAKDKPLSATIRGEKYLLAGEKNKQNGYLYEVWQEMKQLARVPSYNLRATALKNVIAGDKNFVADSLAFEAAELRETKYLNSFSLLLNQIHSQQNKIDKVRWEQLAGDLNYFTASNDKYLQRSGYRCADHTWRSVSEYYFNLMERKEFELAVSIAEILTYFNLKTINPWYLMARASAMMKRKKQAATHLKAAIRYGNLPAERAEKDETLLTIFSLKELQDILEKK